MPSIASDYTLRIFGNANMDDAIDEEDLDLIEAMIGGSEAETELADANHDGLIDEDDLTRVEEIIRGDPTEVTLIDSTERVVKVKTPAERIVPLNMRHATAVIVLGGEDEIVGVDSTVLDRELLFENLSTRALVGSTKEPDIEAILELEPDLVITFTHLAPQDQLDDKLPSEVALVRFDLSRSENLKEEMMALGYLIGNREAVKDYEEWYDLYMGAVLEKVSGIPEEDRVRVFMERESTDREASVRWAYASDTGYTDLCDVAGGVNIAKEKIDYNADIEAEWVMEENPEVIIGLSYSGGYRVDDDAPLMAYRDAIMSAPGFELVDAVKNGRVYIISGDFSLGPQMTIGAVAVAKWLYPELFSDLDIEAIHQEFLKKFMHVDYDLTEHGAFVYPPLD
ncbi:MAG: ABC transporter substrate-binding protein [Methanothrix sp.]|nr:ABC transporter substrate-binding protein [Methanothrix harundinacea]MDD2637344.1 ABC transporter substrate-binding protein [Methanothrix sp.]MDD3709700.1 ABC transporter substrate-binding protein [Methanothrix sp.]MDD5768075.1 ABC transporter substrate-binding protein [Methanothrix sp.]MDI9398662.1 ABC transporter substrate-binding protein [Euryarchaeota archaeon]